MKKKSLYKKLNLGTTSILGNVAGAADALSPALMPEYDKDFTDFSKVMKNKKVNADTRAGLQSQAENMLISSGTPVGMAAGVGLKGTRLLSDGIDKVSTNKWGQSKSGLGFVAQSAGNSLDHVGTIVKGLDNLKNDDLSTGEKILGFTPIGSTYVQNKVAEIEKQKYMKELSSNSAEQGEENYKRALAEGFNPHGNEHKQHYKLGGSLNGKLNQVSSENIEVEGPKHENGGVKLPSLGVELEGGETINEDFVFSEELGFAQKHKPLAKAIGKIEKKPQDRFTKNSLDKLKSKEDQLKAEQESLKESLGLENDAVMKNGGKLYKKMILGGDSSRGTGSPHMIGDLTLDEYTKGYADYMNSGGENNRVTGVEGSYSTMEYKPAAANVPPSQNGLFKAMQSAGSAVPNVMPYVDNIANFLINRKRAKEDIPQEATTKYLKPQTYDYSAEKAEADNQREAFNRNITENTSNTSVANSNKAAGLFQTIRAKNLINEKETNVNTQERARVSGINTNIEAGNNKITLANKMRKLGARDDIRREDSANVANLVDKKMYQERDKKMYDLMSDQQIINLASADPKAVAYIKSVVGEERWNKIFNEKKKNGGTLYKNLK